MKTINSSLYQDHWNHHERLPDVYYNLIGGYMVTIGTLGTLGNAGVIALFCRCRRLRTIPNYFLINLAVADLVTCLVGFPWMAAACFIGYWPFGSFVCHGYAMIVAVTGFASILSMMMIAMDRCLAISKCLHSHMFSSVVGSHLGSKAAIYAILGIWLYAGILALPPLFGWNSFVLDGMEVSCTFDYLSQDDVAETYIVFIFVLGFVIPFLVILVCYVLIFGSLKSHEITFARESNPSNIVIRKSTDEKIIKIGCVVVFMFCFAWLPYAVIALAASYGDLDVTPLVQALTAIFAKASTVYNPIIYIISHPNFRKEIQRLLSRTVNQSSMPMDHQPKDYPIASFICCRKRNHPKQNYGLQVMESTFHIAVNMNVARRNRVDEKIKQEQRECMERLIGEVTVNSEPHGEKIPG